MELGAPSFLVRDLDRTVRRVSIDGVDEGAESRRLRRSVETTLAKFLENADLTFREELSPLR